MLDVGFSEILLTSAIALIVLGPERLPKVARQVGNWMGRARAMARQLTEQLEREVSAEELMRTQNKPDKGSSASDSMSGSFASGNFASGSAAPDSSAPPEAQAHPAPQLPGSDSAAAYSPETATPPHGADWHATPPASKPGND